MDNPTTNETNLPHQAGAVVKYAAALTLLGVAGVRTVRFAKRKLAARKAAKPETTPDTEQ